jgi:hypothetical protein
MSNLRVQSSLLSGVALLLLGVAPALAEGPFRFYSITPCRLVDTRIPAEGPPLSANTTRDFQVQGKCGVPVGAKAAFLNVTAVSPPSQGHLRLFPSGAPMPLVVSTLNFQGGEPAVANGAIIPLSDNADDLSVYTYFLQGSGTTDLVLDVTGYFAPPTP